MNTEVNEPPELPEAVSRSIEGKDSGTASALLAVHRNRLSMRRTGRSDRRSSLVVLSLLLIIPGAVTVFWILAK